MARGNWRADRVAVELQDALLAERAADLRDIEKRVLRALGYTNATARALPDEAVLAADEFTPSDLSSLDRTRVTALVMARGGATSHAAIIARQIGIPSLVAVGDALHAVPEGTKSWSMRRRAALEYAPTALDVERARLERQRLAGVREANRPHVGRSGGNPATDATIEVAANIATLDDAQTRRRQRRRFGRPAAHRTALHPSPGRADEGRSTRTAIKGIVDALKGRTAIIRTLDVGADKEVDYLTLPPEDEPGARLARHPSRAGAS